MADNSQVKDASLANVTVQAKDNTSVFLPAAVLADQGGAYGASMFFNSALSTTVQSVKSSAGRLYGWYIYNPNGSVEYVQIFNVASGSVTLGSTTPTLSLGIAPNMSGSARDIFPGLFATAISCAATTTPTGNTAPGTGLVVNLFYV